MMILKNSRPNLLLEIIHANLVLYDAHVVHEAHLVVDYVYLIKLFTDTKVQRKRRGDVK